ncbi:hypothetical protein [Pseudoalteromonas sp. OOF1S-7]|uniref:hypothetical protein n=1 Tax=Pseudoalteromonas sp. OOF1S-7 TaxID=2917757 RepID=UPI001EF47BAB|nr:hypothetical protein [Pseudoalteromonas sp. OOF1S-7]MCG7537652.1 hypothetical protein [Pseudoalteromonas sp. OOF1S-7]
MTASIFRAFTFSIILILGLIVVTALLPSGYQAQTAQRVAKQDLQRVQKYLNAEHWQALLTPHPDLQLSFLTQAQQVGGYGELVHPWGLAEVTVLNLEQQRVTIQLRFNTEHIAHIELLLQPQADALMIQLSARGENHTPFVGGLYARFAAYYIEQQLKMMMNQLISQLKLHTQGQV